MLSEAQKKYILLCESPRSKQAKKRSLAEIQKYFNSEQVDAEDIWRRFETEFYHDPNFRESAIMRLEPLFCRLALESGFAQGNPDNQKLNRLKDIMGFLHNMDKAKKLNLGKIGLGLSYDALEQEFGTMLDKQKQEEDDRINSKEYERNSDYEIVGPVDYATAHEYGNESCPGSELCYTQSENTWKEYTYYGRDGFVKGGGFKTNIYIYANKEDMEQAFEDCDIVVGEIDYKELMTQEYQMVLTEKIMVAPPDSTLDKLLTNEEYAFVEQEFNKYLGVLGVNLQQQNGFKISMFRY